MSTRSSLLYWWQVHIYIELTTDWVHLELGDWLNVRLYKRFRGIYFPRWLGRLACRTNHHDWFIDEWLPPNHSIYKCLRCHKIEKLT